MVTVDTLRDGSRTNNVQAARLRRTRWYLTERGAFMAELCRDIARLVRKQSVRHGGVRAAQRTSDIRWKTCPRAGCRMSSRHSLRCSSTITPRYPTGVARLTCELSHDVQLFAPAGVCGHRRQGARVLRQPRELCRGVQACSAATFLDRPLSRATKRTCASLTLPALLSANSQRQRQA